MIGVSTPPRASRLPRPLTWWQSPLPLVVASALLCLGVANVRLRATWHEVEDGVLWVAGGDGLVAGEIASASPAERVGIKQGDVLLAIEGRPVQEVEDVINTLHTGHAGTELHY